MAERKPPIITEDTPIGPDVDLDREDVRLPGEVRLTKTMAAGIVDEVHQEAARSGGREPELVPLHQVLAELLRLLRELRLRKRAEQALRSLAHAIEHTKVH